MKRKGFSPNEGIVRVMCRRFAVVWVDKVGWSGGTNRPESRKVLMLDMRRRDDAEGERRMMGSERFEGTAEESGLEVFAAGRAASDADFVGTLPGRDDDEGMPLRRPRKVSACLRTWEKSC